MNKPTPTKRGRPAFVPTAQERKQVEALAGYGVPQDQIALLVRDGIDKGTLLKYFRHELDRGMAAANAKVAETLFQQAVSGNTAALIFWTKVRMGWRETQAVDITTGGESFRGIDREAAIRAIRDC